jgi:tetratricopeptide (TPR) repeat protein
MIKSNPLMPKNYEAAAWRNISSAYGHLSKLDSQYFALKQSLQLIKDKDDPSQQTQAYHKIAILHLHINAYDKALFWIKKSERFLDVQLHKVPVQDRIFKSKILVILSRAYLGLDSLELAQKYAHKAFEIIQEDTIYSQHTLTLAAWSKIERRLGNNKLALDLAQKSYENAKICKIATPKLIGTINMAYHQLESNNFQAAEFYADSGLELLEKKPDKGGMALYKQSLYEYKYRISANKGNYQDALYYLEQEKIFEDSLNNENSARKLAFLDAEQNYELERIGLQQKNALQKAKLSRSRMLTIGLAIILALVIYLLVQQYYQSKLKAEKFKTISNLNKQLEYKTESLRVAVDRLEKFSNSITHDVLSHLDLLISTGNFLVKKNDPNSFQGFYEKGMSIARKLKTYCTELLDLHQNPIPNEHSIHFTDPNPILSSVLNSFNIQIEEKQLKFQFEELVPIKLPEIVLEKVFHNLIQNVIKHATTHKTPMVYIGTKNINNSSIIFFKDNGKGFEEKVLADVFQNKRKGLGSTQNLLKKYGWQLKIENLAEGGCKISIIKDRIYKL